MKTTHKIITAVAAFALSGSLVFAAGQSDGNANGHERHGHGRFGHHRMARLAKKLNLTDAQKSQLKADHQAFRDANKDFFAQVKATRQEAHAAREANDTAKLDALKPTIESQRAHMKELRDQERTQFLSVLTPDQKAELDQLKAQRKAKHEGQSQH
jgi:protein CpxP